MFTSVWKMILSYFTCFLTGTLHINFPKFRRGSKCSRFLEFSYVEEGKIKLLLCANLSDKHPSDLLKISFDHSSIVMSLKICFNYLFSLIILVLVSGEPRTNNRRLHIILSVY